MDRLAYSSDVVSIFRGNFLVLRCAVSRWLLATLGDVAWNEPQVLEETSESDERRGARQRPGLFRLGKWHFHDSGERADRCMIRI
jgi:hypothetical protein